MVKTHTPPKATLNPMTNSALDEINGVSRPDLFLRDARMSSDPTANRAMARYTEVGTWRDRLR